MTTTIILQFPNGSFYSQDFGPAASHPDAAVKFHNLRDAAKAINALAHVRKMSARARRLVNGTVEDLR